MGDMQSALRLKPTFTDAYNNLASALVQKGMIPAALQCYQAALQINPNLVSLSCMKACQQAGAGLKQFFISCVGVWNKSTKKAGSDGMHLSLPCESLLDSASSIC